MRALVLHSVLLHTVCGLVSDPFRHCVALVFSHSRHSVRITFSCDSLRTFTCLQGLVKALFPSLEVCSIFAVYWGRGCFFFASCRASCDHWDAMVQ